jgi:hypothetical protein
MKGKKLRHKNKNRSILFTLFVLGCIGFGFFIHYNQPIEIREDKEAKEIKPDQAREPWMTIFVHGSFGSLLGFLSYSQVVSDQVEGSQYKKVVNKMRRDPFFFREQPLLQKGLVWVTPTFDLSKTNDKKYAAYPFARVYQNITEYVKPKREKNYFYTFGWSGLMSQRRRALEAIRFYNAVNEKLAEYHAKGIYPKIRVLAHSHGGNLLAYVGAIDGVLSNEENGGEAFTLLKERYNKLPVKREVLNNKGQKRFDYKPELPGFFIDELILWGVPIQPETENLFASSVFKKCYHFYSNDDIVQRADWVSTKQGYSNRRFDLTIDSNKKLVQSRIMIERDVKNNTASAEERTGKDSFWSILFSGGAIVSPASEDPTHKELWFFNWHDEQSQGRKFFLSPFPVAVFSPLLIELLEKKVGVCDADINIVSSDDGFKFCLYDHGGQCQHGDLCVDMGFFKLIEKKVFPWRLDRFSSEGLLDTLTRYTKK